MPLFLQFVSKQAGIGSLVKLVAWLLRHTVSATANAIGMPCRSACSIQRQTYLTSQTAQAGLPGQKTRQKTQRTDNGMRTCVQSRSRFLRLLCVAHQPPDAVRHLRRPPESRPRPGLNVAVSCSSHEQCLNCILCCKSYHSTPVITGGAWERRSHPTRLEHGVIKPQSSRCLMLWICVSRKHANGEFAVFVEALHTAVNLG